MGTAIKATAVSTEQDVRSSVRHAALAAQRCLAAAGVDAGQVDVLINVGVYRDENMCEPAMAALVQKEIGMSLDYLRHPDTKAGFSFDLTNSACGILNGVQVGGAFLNSGSAEHVLIVSSDAHPSNSPEPVDGFPYATLGAAMLLERTPDDETGFGRVHADAEVSSLKSPGIAGYVDPYTTGTEGRGAMTIEQEPGYAERLADAAAETARMYAASEGLDLERTLLVTCRPTPGFATAVAERLGVSEQAAVAAEGVAGDPHTSALTLAYHQAAARGQNEAYDAVLFLTAGAGLTTACAAYRPRAELLV